MTAIVMSTRIRPVHAKHVILPFLVATHADIMNSSIMYIAIPALLTGHRTELQSIQGIMNVL